jgi:hypothetical protein
MLVSQTGLCLPLGLYPSGDLGLFTYYTTKKRKVTRFLTTKPLKPESAAQKRQRSLWAAIAHQWTALDATTKAAWNKAARGAYCRITAFNLYIHVHATRNFECLSTIAHQSGVPLDQLV